MDRRRIYLATLLVLALFAMAVSQVALAQPADYIGSWVCVGVDLGDGVKLAEYQGIAVEELMQLRLEPDGGLIVISMGQEVPGTWSASDEGIIALIEEQQVVFSMRDGQLVNVEQGVTSYLEKTPATPKGVGLLSLMAGKSYVGRWVSAAVDQGDGVLTTEIDGMPIDGSIALQIGGDGSILVSTMGAEAEGTWEEIDGGIRITVDGNPVDLQLIDGQLVEADDGVTLYFRREAQPSEKGDPLKASPVGLWEAAHYETGGYTFDINMLFPDGCILELRENGTGEVPLTPEYTETFTWSRSEDGLSIFDSHVLSSPDWDAQAQQLRLHYGSDAVTVVFQKLPGEEALDAPLPAAAETPAPAPTQEPAAEPTEIAIPQPTPAAGGADPSDDFEGVTTNLFSVSFPGDGWVENADRRNDRKDYSAVHFALQDADGNIGGSVSLTASIEKVRNYRDKIKALKERAADAGKDALDEAIFGGVGFLGTSYERWGWQYIEYAARSADEGATLTILVERPELIGDRLPAVLDSIAYHLPVLTPPNVDPPLPEDGAPYVPVPSAVSLGARELSAEWLQLDKSIVVDSIFNNCVRLVDNRLYVLTGETLRAFAFEGGRFAADSIFPDGVMALPDKFEYLAQGEDGILFVSHGVFNTLAIQEGRIIQENPISGDLVMHPSGEWGLTFWANVDPMRITAGQDGTLDKEPWVLSGLSDAAARKGRFSMISRIHITKERIYIAGTDALAGDAQRVAVYDLKGEEMFAFGGEEFSADDSLGSVTGILETPDSILIMDGNLRAFKLFSLQGEYMGEVRCDQFLGTDYPWLSSMIAFEDGALVAASQARKDGSANELLLFLVRGF